MYLGIPRVHTLLCSPLTRFDFKGVLSRVYTLGIPGYVPEHHRKKHIQYPVAPEHMYRNRGTAGTTHGRSSSAVTPPRFQTYALGQAGHISGRADLATQVAVCGCV